MTNLTNKKSATGQVLQCDPLYNRVLLRLSEFPDGKNEIWIEVPESFPSGAFDGNLFDALIDEKVDYIDQLHNNPEYLIVEQ